MESIEIKKEISLVKSTISVLGLKPEVEQQIMEDLERRAEQVDGPIDIKTKEELVMDIIHSDNPVYNEIYHIKTVENDVNWENIDTYVSVREIILSGLIGKPYPSSVITGKRFASLDHDLKSYRTKITEAGRDYGADAKTAHITNIKQKSVYQEEKYGIIEFDGGVLHITSKDLMASGLDPEQMGWEPITKERIIKKEIEYKNRKNELKEKKKDRNASKYDIMDYERLVESAEQDVEEAKKDYKKYVLTPKSMANAAKKHETTKSEVGGVKGFFDRVLGKENINKGNIEDGKEEK